MSAINLSEVLKLPVQERIRIVEAIWDSVAEHPEQVELLPWQAEELDRRVAAYQANPSEGIAWEEVKRRVLGGASACQSFSGLKRWMTSLKRFSGMRNSVRAWVRSLWRRSMLSWSKSKLAQTSFLARVVSSVGYRPSLSMRHLFRCAFGVH